MLRIAVDAMGGDHAPHAIVSGAVDAARKAKGKFEIVLVGDKEQIERELKHHHFIKDISFDIVHASQQIEMEESPSSALRKKPDASIVVAAKLHAEKKVDAVVSAGNTGAVMAAAYFLLQKIEGVLRPTLGSFIPHESGVGFMVDAGANVDCKPEHLYQFSIMGSIFVNHILEINPPKVGLLNIGEEESKGTEIIQKTYQMLKNAPLNFIGNVEGRDVLRGNADVVVCDGFVGNILLKFTESFSRRMLLGLKQTIGRNLIGSIGHRLILPKLRKMLTAFDYQEYGGAPLLGVKGNFIICHGRSTQKAIRVAIQEAVKMAEEKVAEHIETQIGLMKGTAFEK